jgi:hypothetical protein
MFSYICQPKFKISLSRCEGKKKAIYNASILLTGEIEFDRGETYDIPRMAKKVLWDHV